MKKIKVLSTLVFLLLVSCASKETVNPEPTHPPQAEILRERISTSHWAMTNEDFTNYYDTITLTIQDDKFVLRVVGLDPQTKKPKVAMHVGQLLNNNEMVYLQSEMKITYDSNYESIIKSEDLKIPILFADSQFIIYIFLENSLLPFISIIPNSYYK